jgi:hypothetical protein
LGASHAFQEVLRRTHLSGFAEIATVFAEEVRTPCADSVVLYRPNYQPALLVAVPAADAVGRPPLPVLGTVAGRRFGATAIAELDADGGSGRRLRLSLLDG